MTDDEIIEAIRVRVSDGRPTDHNSAVALAAPASEEAIADAERIIGYPLPPLLQRIYREIANGGVGPFSGVEGLPGGYGDDMIALHTGYLRATLDPDCPPPPPRGVLFFCDFGCAMWSLLDCRQPEGQMWWWDQGERHKLRLTLPEWFDAWLTGDINKRREDPRLMLADEAWQRPDEDA